MQHAQHAMLDAASNELLADEYYGPAYFQNDCAYFDLLDGHFPVVDSVPSDEYNELHAALDALMYSKTGLRCSDHELYIGDAAIEEALAKYRAAH